MLKDSPDAPDRLRLSSTTVFVVGMAVTAVLVGLIVLYVPTPPPEASLTSVRSYAAFEQAGGGPETPQASGSSGQDTEPAAASGDRSPEGLYVTFCSQCHGRKGDGDAPLARMMASKPTSLVKGPFRFAREPEAIALLIRAGAGAMPGFAEEITPEEAQSLARYVLDLETDSDESAPAASATPPAEAP